MYNVAIYVERCLRSLEEQDIPQENYEIICINDGSPDNCSDIVRGLQFVFSNIVLLEQENQGVSMARNNGIEAATGRYILFIDPDDYVEKNSLGRKLDIISRHSLDVLYTGFTILNESLQPKYKYDNKQADEIILTGIEYYTNYDKGSTEVQDPDRSVAILFKREFLVKNGLRYLAGVPYLEDSEFLARVNTLALRVSFASDPFYLRTTRPGSATNSRMFFSEEAIEGFIKAATNLAAFKNNMNITGDAGSILNYSIIHFIILYLESHTVSGYLSGFSTIRESLLLNGLRKLDLTGMSSFYKRMAKCYNVSVHLLYLNWLLYKFQKSLRIRAGRLLEILLPE